MKRAGVFATLAMVAGVGAITIGSARLASASPGLPRSSAPPGNNGTIKIDGTPLLNPGRGDEANHPHVTCSLALTFFGYDAAPDTAVVQFSAQPPSGRFTPVAANGSLTNTVHFTGSGPGNSFDKSVGYTLDVSGLTAQAKQGYHVKVSVEVTYSQGSDDKSKVFWYKPCAPDQATTTTSTLPEQKGSGGQLGCVTNCSTTPPTTTPPTGGR